MQSYLSHLEELEKIIGEHDFNFIEHFFELDLATQQEIQALTPQFGHNGLGEFVYYRTYSLRQADGTREKWNDTIIRVVNGTFSVLKNHLIKAHLPWDEQKYAQYARQLAFSMFHMEFLPPGRGLWAMGTRHVIERGSLALNNCAFCDTSDLVKSAVWTMNALMCGCGVGFNTNWKNQRLYRPEGTETYIIPDSRYGWINSLGLLVMSYSRPGLPEFEFDYSLIRPKGAPIRGFGGTASGYKPLEMCHRRIRAYLRTRYRIEQGMSPNESIVKMVEELREHEHQYQNPQLIQQIQAQAHKTYGPTRLVVDIFNAIASCVVAGNVRRSSEIAIGTEDDQEFIKLKDFTHNPERMTIMWMSNNTVSLSKSEEFHQHIPRIAKQLIESGNGEPGISNLKNIREWGRVGKRYDSCETYYREQEPDLAIGQNPCGEICLESYELCCLSEVFPGRCLNSSGEFSREVFYRACQHAAFYATVVSLLPTESVDSNQVIARNHRIGVSLSGTSVLSEKLGYSPMISLLREAYEIIRKENYRITRLAGVPSSLRVTTIKPSGTISQLAGVPPGIHFPPESRYVIRRVRVSKNTTMHQFLQSSGLPFEEDNYTDNTVVYSFPLDQGPSRSVKEVSIWEQLEMAKLFQRWYSDNAVSITINYQPHEKKYLEQAISTSVPYIKSLSFLPISNETYPQSPYEGITQEEYEKLLAEMPSLDWSAYTQMGDSTPKIPKFCDGDSCTLWDQDDQLKVLSQEFGLTTSSNRDQCHETLVELIRQEETDLVRVLLREFKLTAEEIRSNENQALRTAAVHGQVSILRLLHQLFDLGAEDARARNLEALTIPSIKNRVKVLEILHDEYGLETEDARAAKNEALKTAAEYGETEVIRTLHDLYGLGADDAREANALIEAASRQDPETLILLQELFGLTTEDARQAEAILWAADDDCLECFNVLYSHYGLTAEDARIQNYKILIEAARDGQVKILQALHDTYGLSVEIINDNYWLFKTLTVAARHGQVEVLRLLYEVYGLRTEDARGMDNEALKLASGHGQDEALRLLHNLYGLTTEDARAQDNYALKRAVKYGEVEVLKVLHQLYGLGLEDARQTQALKLALKYDQDSVIRVLFQVYGLTEEDAQHADLLTEAANKGKLGLVRELRLFTI